MATLTAIQDPVYNKSDFVYEVAMGREAGKETVNKFGFNEDIDIASGEEVVAVFGGSFVPGTNIIDTPQTFTIAYNNTTDGSGQNGATQLLISYLDANFELQIAVHVLGATGSDVTSFSGLGINRVVVLANGGTGWNESDITITATTDGTTQAQIPATYSVTQQCIYHIPISHTFMMNFIYIGALKVAAGTEPKVTIRIYSYSRFTATRYEVFVKDIDTAVENHLEINLNQPFVFSGREVLYVTAQTDKDNAKVAVRFSGIQEINQ